MQTLAEPLDRPGAPSGLRACEGGRWGRGGRCSRPARAMEEAGEAATPTAVPAMGRPAGRRAPGRRPRGCGDCASISVSCSRNQLTNKPFMNTFTNTPVHEHHLGTRRAVNKR